MARCVRLMQSGFITAGSCHQSAGRGSAMKVTRTVPDGVQIEANGVVVMVTQDVDGSPFIKIIPNEEYESFGIPMIEGSTGCQLQLQILLIPRTPDRSKCTDGRLRVQEGLEGPH